MNKKYQIQKGITIVELVLAVSIFAILIGVISINLLNARTKATLHSTAHVLASNIKHQQKKAMFLYTEGRSTAGSYGLYFETDKYTLFSGDIFNQQDPSNLVVPLDNGVIFSSINLPGQYILFASKSGEISNFSSSQQSLVIRDEASQEQKTIQINALGVITSIE